MDLTAIAQFGVIISLAAVLGIIATRFKQPAILGYIITGLVVGGLTHTFGRSKESLELFSKIGITFLLFILGLELNLDELKKLGKVALATGLGQILFTTISGFLICLLFGYGTIVSFYIAIGLTFSSTIIIIKLFSQKNKLETLYGKIAVSFLIVQDFAAILILMALSAFKNIESGELSLLFVGLGTALLKGLLAATFIFIFSKYIFNPILNSIRNDKEILFLTVIAWALILAAFMESHFIGFSIEIGGLLAGISLSNRFEHLQIESWTKPLRDFFITMFFIILGLEINLNSVRSVIIPAIILSIFVLILKPIIVMMIMSYMGFSIKISFLTSLAVAQISEFSLIIAKFGFDLGHLNSSILTLLTIVGAITMTISTYMIFYNEELYVKLEKYLKIFEFKNKTKQDINIETRDFQIIMFGCHRLGKNLLRHIFDKKNDILVIDLDPKIIQKLKEDGYEAIYGDVGDNELYNSYKLDKAKIIISTVPSLRENINLLNFIKEIETRPMTIISCTDDDSAIQLYENGADFVIYPHFLSSDILSSIVSKGTLSKSMVNLRSRLMDTLKMI